MATKEEIIKELYKNKTVPKKRRSVHTTAPFEIFAIDLADMGTKSAQYNKGYRYIFVCIDIFSRYAWGIPLKTKEAKETLKALKSILNQYTTKPKSLWLDSATEFYNSDWIKYLNENDITMYSTYGEHKSAYVERLNRTLKRKTAIEKELQETRNWIDVIEDVFKSYNTTKHSSIKTTPELLFTKPVLQKKESNIQKKEIKQNVKEGKKDKLKFNIDDIVRLSVQKPAFEKSSSTPNWTKEIFRVIGYGYTNPITYKVEDMKHETLEGSFYAEELQKTKEKPPEPTPAIEPKQKHDKPIAKPKPKPKVKKIEQPKYVEQEGKRKRKIVDYKKLNKGT